MKKEIEEHYKGYHEYIEGSEIFKGWGNGEAAREIISKNHK